MAKQSIQIAKSKRRTPTKLDLAHAHAAFAERDLKSLHEIANGAVEFAIETQERFDELRAQFNAIVKEDRREVSCRLARIGRIASREYAADTEAKFRHLRDALRGVNVPAASEFAS